MPISALIKLMRPHQYIKNLFIFLPIFFALRITDLDLLLDASLAFIAFSFAASAIYTLNDYCDMEDDKEHPKKKYRPLASGAISKYQAMMIMSVLFIFSFSLMAFLSLQATAILSAYVLLNIAYSFSLKQVAIIDVVIIALGFVLRIFVGSAVTSTPLSMWIVVMTFLLALFMALAKRRDDVLIYMNTGKKMRKVVDGYNLQFLDTAMSIMASIVMMSYVMYTTSPDVIARISSPYLYLTAFFVLLGVLRYLQISFVMENSGSPTKIVFTDRFIQLVLIGWIANFAWILY